ncbi:hypothetical protein JCM10212_002163 [Sporobolomyces blumeae]
MGLWSRTYVCCAVPLYNSGIYAILAQFLILSTVTGVLCFASPSIITVGTPEFVSYVLGALAIAVAAWQMFGFFGVYRDRVGLFKTYSRINMVLVVLALLLALAIIIISAVRHSAAIDTCQNLFSTDSASDSDTTAESICNIWTWVQVGIMGLLFVIVGLCELYFLMYSSIYASEQKLDHAKYNSVYSTAAEEIRQSGYWDGVRGASYSQDEDLAVVPPLGAGYGHGRGMSKSSGLRNEIGKEGDGRIDRDEQGGYYDPGGEKGGTVVSGYREAEYDDEERYAYRGGAGGAGHEQQYGRYDEGFRPPGQDSMEHEQHHGRGNGAKQYRY